MVTVTNALKKVPKGLPTMIAKSVGCTPQYAKDVLNGKYDDRETDLVKNIKSKAANIELILTKNQY
ncbi:hypothetical protein [Sphingobacterium spiritivorum]|uniref:hypothetical protein n=1 Tax=Sphingobacterium spiritivorum TaxID=258 RepID=UPI003DA54BC8